MDDVTHTPTSKVHTWMLILLTWIAVFSIVIVGILLTKSSSNGLSSSEMAAACQNGTINGITTNLTRISEACQDVPTESATIPIQIASSLIPSEVTPDKQAAYIAAQFPTDKFADVAITTQSFPNGTLYTVTDTLIGAIGDGKELSMHFFGATNLVVVNYTGTDLSVIKNSFDWSMVK